jgi:hypothetical protein
LGIVLFVGAEVGDAPDNLFGIVASRKGAFGVCPIAFGLRERLSGNYRSVTGKASIKNPVFFWPVGVKPAK